MSEQKDSGFTTAPAKGGSSEHLSYLTGYVQQFGQDGVSFRDNFPTSVEILSGGGDFYQAADEFHVVILPVEVVR